MLTGLLKCLLWRDALGTGVSGEGTKMLEGLKLIHGLISILGKSSRRILDKTSILIMKLPAKVPHGAV